MGKLVTIDRANHSWRASKYEVLRKTLDNTIGLRIDESAGVEDGDADNPQDESALHTDVIFGYFRIDLCSEIF